MKSLLDFLLEIGKLKNIKRKGITFYGVKQPDSATDHSFRMALMTWLFGKRKRIDIKKAIKIALIHDMCKVYTKDITPYDNIFPKNKKTRREFVKRWRHLLLKEKEKWSAQKLKKEYSAFKKLTAKLPKELKEEMLKLWIEYTKLKTPEARFVY